MFSLFSRFRKYRLLPVLLGFAWFRSLAHGAAPVATAAQPSATDVLVYTDGDRLRGHLVERTATTIVFQSDRFGIVRVPVADAQVITNQTPAAASEIAAKTRQQRSAAREEVSSNQATAANNAATAANNAATAANNAAAAENNAAAANARAWLLSPQQLTLALRRVFGPWHGRFSFSSEVDSDTSERNTDLTEAHIMRKWKSDEVDMTARYDFSDTNHVTTTDIFKADGFWRHALSTRYFSLYHPTLEWNRAFILDNVPTDYLLLQQEIGGGVKLFSSDRRNLSVGLAENIFDVWQTAPTSTHSEHRTESMFVEADWKLPWRTTLTERGIWYYSILTGREGWENRVELNKKLTETISVGIRHETRHNNPDVRVQDYSLLRLLVGLDF